MKTLAPRGSESTVSVPLAREAIAAEAASKALTTFWPSLLPSAVAAKTATAFEVGAAAGAGGGAASKMASAGAITERNDCSAGPPNDRDQVTAQPPAGATESV